MKPSDGAGEDDDARELSEKLPPPLLTEATKVLSAFPEADAAGLAVADGVSLHPDVGIEIEGSIPEGVRGICGLVPTAVALRVIELHGGAEMREAAEPGSEKEDGMLFVTMVTADGVRFGKVRIWMPQPMDPSLPGPSFGTFFIHTNRNDEFKLLRESIERAKRNPVKPGKFFQRIVANEKLDGGRTVERIKLYCVDLRRGLIVITESSDGRLYARSVQSVASVG